MKWKQWLLGILLVTLVPATACAGDINAEEQSVLAVACGTFEYEGVVYQATPEYMAEARAKLMQDDVDLTPEQAQEAITSIYANVQTGIQEGYIVPISGSGNTDGSQNGGTATGSGNGENTGNAGTSGQPNTGTGNDKGNNNAGNSNVGNSNTGNSNTGNGNTGNGNAGNSNTGNGNTGNGNAGNSNTGNGNAENGNAGNSNTGNDNTENNSIENNNTDSNNETVQEDVIEEKTPEEIQWETVELPKLTEQPLNIIPEHQIELQETSNTEIVIKDTGYEITGIWIVPVIFLIGTGICAMCIIKYHLLAHNNEP